MRTNFVYPAHHFEKGLLRKDGQPGFNTPSGKMDIASSLLAEYGYDPLPIYTEPVEGPLSSPELLKEFPLVFNSGARIPPAFRSNISISPTCSRCYQSPTCSGSDLIEMVP